MKVRINANVLLYIVLSALITTLFAGVAFYAIKHDASWAVPAIAAAIGCGVATAAIPLARFIRFKLKTTEKGLDAEVVIERIQEVVKEGKATLPELTEAFEGIEPITKKMKNAARKAAERIEDLSHSTGRAGLDTQPGGKRKEPIIQDLSEIHDQLEAHEAVYKTISEVASALRSQETAT